MQYEVKKAKKKKRVTCYSLLEIKSIQADEEKCQEDKSIIIGCHNKLDKCVICGWGKLQNKEYTQSKLQETDKGSSKIESTVFGVTIKAHCLKVNPSGFTVSYLESFIWNTPFSIWPCHSHPLVWLTDANLHQFETVWIRQQKAMSTVNEVSETKGLKCFCWQVKLKLDRQGERPPLCWMAHLSPASLRSEQDMEKRKTNWLSKRSQVPRQFEIEAGHVGRVILMIFTVLFFLYLLCFSFSLPLFAAYLRLFFFLLIFMSLKKKKFLIPSAGKDDLFG